MATSFDPNIFPANMNPYQFPSISSTDDLFPGFPMTKQETNKFMNSFVNMLVTQIRTDDARIKKVNDELKQSEDINS